VNVEDLREIIADLSGDMPIEFCTFSMYKTEEVNIKVVDEALQISANI